MRFERSLESAVLAYRFLAVVSLFVLGCSSARMSDQKSNRLFFEGRYDLAVTRLKEGVQKQGESGRDLLLYLLDLGLALHTGGWYEESNQIFQRADRVAEIKDYTSLSVETVTLLTTDYLKDYRGEDFENVLISVYLAMNYALLGQTEDAIVEAKRVNHKLYRMVQEGKRKYKQNAFARYLSAILYEMADNANDAYIDYKYTYELNSKIPTLGSDLWRCAWQLKRSDDMERWDKEFHLTENDHALARKRGAQGELIILYENGISPEKRPNPYFYQLPKFYSRYNPVAHAQVFVNDQNYGETFILENIEQTAIQNLDEKYGGLIAKKLAGVVAKEGVGYMIARENPILGLIAKIFMYASDQADLRSWNLLPKDLQILRIPVKPGSYRVRLVPGLKKDLPEKMIQVSAGQKRFMNFRYVP